MEGQYREVKSVPSNKNKKRLTLYILFYSLPLFPLLPSQLANPKFTNFMVCDL